MKNLSSFLTAGMIASLILSLAPTESEAQTPERKYIRKSISSTGLTAFRLPLSQDVRQQLSDMIYNRLAANIDTSRFDNNPLTQASVLKFAERLVAGDSVQTALEKTLLPQILQVVDAVKEVRAKGNLKEEDIAAAAVDKLKGSGLTLEDVERVKNCAYVYVPIVTDYKESGKIDTTGKLVSLTAQLNAEVLWYKIVVPESGQPNAKLVASLKEVGFGNSDVGKTYPLKKREVDHVVMARIMAAQMWASEIAVRMRTEMPDFMLSAEIVSHDAAARLAEAKLGKREGVQLDDGFIAVETQSEGETTKLQTVGFFRAGAVIDNTVQEKPSMFDQYLGSQDLRGAVLLEHKQGLDLVVRPSNSSLYGFGGDVSILYNLAPIIGIKQFFIKAEGAFYVGNPNSRIRVDNEERSGTLTGGDGTITGFGGFVKKFWLGNVALLGAANFGYISRTSPDRAKDPNKMTGFGVRADAGAELLLTPDLALTSNIGYLFTPNTALSVGVGISFSLPSLNTALKAVGMRGGAVMTNNIDY